MKSLKKGVILVPIIHHKRATFLLFIGLQKAKELFQFVVIEDFRARGSFLFLN
jgi:hypothetical protein